MRSKWNGVTRRGNRFVSFARASGRGDAAWAGERNDPSVARAKSRHMFLLTGVLRLPAGVLSGVPVVSWVSQGVHHPLFIQGSSFRKHVRVQSTKLKPLSKSGGSVNQCGVPFRICWRAVQGAVEGCEGERQQHVSGMMFIGCS